MKIELTSLQEEQLKKQARKEVVDEIKKQKTLSYFIYRISTALFFGAIFAAAVLFMNWIADIALTGYAEKDNFDSCWIKEDILGINTKTGEQAELQRHFDCSDFKAN